MRIVNPDLLLLDIHLPDLDGLTVCHILSADDTSSHIPVFMMSARSDDNIVAQVRYSGAAAFLQKPIGYQVLLRNIQSTFCVTNQLAAQSDIA